jgi:ABC-type transport system involved in multi-copper enzyme maturation permease subunit
MRIGPLNLGLLHRAWREIAWTSLVFAMVVGSISGLLAYALPRIQARFMQRQFIPPGVRQFRDAIFGFDSTGAGVSEIAFALAWSHPIVLALLSAHAIMVCTRVPAAEVERGTIDVLFALPVSRWSVLVSETSAWLLSAALVLGSVYAGSYIGAQFIKPEYRPDWSRLAMVFANLALVYTLIGTAAMLAATITNRRTWAILAALILTIASLLINFLYTLDPSLEFTKRLAFLSFLDYYRPIRVLMDGAWPLRDMAILGGAAVAIWTIAGIWLSRRDITTT